MCYWMYWWTCIFKSSDQDSHENTIRVPRIWGPDAEENCSIRYLKILVVLQKMVKFYFLLRYWVNLLTHSLKITVVWMSWFKLHLERFHNHFTYDPKKYEIKYKYIWSFNEFSLFSSFLVIMHYNDDEIKAIIMSG